MGRRTTFRLLAVAVAVAAGLLLPATAAAHPLGNFTINHYAGLTIALDRVDLDVVIDMAEIPTFQERQTMDTNGDGSVSDDEARTWKTGACVALTQDLKLDRDGAPLTIAIGASEVSFPQGAGGLSTLRLTCSLSAPIAAPISGPTKIGFSDGSYTDRLGWREVIANSSGTILDTHGLPATSPSQRLTTYPPAMIATPLNVRSATIDARPDPAGVPTSPSPSAPVLPGSVTGPGTSAPEAGAVPGGVAAELPGIFRTADLTPLVILASLLTAVGIGAAHAVTPGHGKTLMAAYLVGSRGTAVHAVGLGLSVAISHTLGIFVLAVLIVGAGSVLPPDVVYRVTPVVAGASIVVIGAWMLAGEIRRRRAATGVGLAFASGGPEHDHTHDPGHPPGHDQANAHGHEHAHAHEHDHSDPAAHDDVDDHSVASAPPGEHSHGGVRHSHVPAAGSTLTWRGLFVLGLAGGLIPSTSALLILLSSIAAGRPAFGLVLVVAFGIGMALVMTGVGLAMIFARTRLDRMPSRSSLGRLAAVAPLVASVAVLSLGLVLTWQAIAGTPVL